MDDAAVKAADLRSKVSEPLDAATLDPSPDNARALVGYSEPAERVGLSVKPSSGEIPHFRYPETQSSVGSIEPPVTSAQRHLAEGF